MAKRTTVAVNYLLPLLLHATQTCEELSPAQRERDKELLHRVLHGNLILKHTEAEQRREHPEL
jgi:hypothetical protein